VAPRRIVPVGDVDERGQQKVEPQAQDDEVEGSALAEKFEPDALERVALTWTDWSWEVVASGDCFCRRAILRLYSDGLADFQAYTSTTSSGDVWLVKGLALLGVHGDELYRIGQVNGPRMELTAYDYFVVRSRHTNPLVFPQQLFAMIHGVRMHYHC
jgi:Family of unknown function (DUF6294)